MSIALQTVKRWTLSETSVVMLFLSAAKARGIQLMKEVRKNCHIVRSNKVSFFHQCSDCFIALNASSA